MKRRQVLAASTLSALGLAGCASGPTGDTTTRRTTTTRTTTETTTEEPTTAASTSEDPTTAEQTTDEQTTDEQTTDEQTTEEPVEAVEFLHPWTAGNGAAGMEAFLDAFRDANPEIDVEAAAVGGFDAQLRNRVSDGAPPDAWATWAGANLDPYASALGDLGSAAPSFDAVPDAVAATGQREDSVVAVPFVAHHVNDLFLNVEVIADAGVDPANVTDVSELLDACERVASETDATPFAHALRDTWTTAQLFETLLLATTGDSGYRAYVAGDLDRGRLREVVVRLDELLSYAPSDAESARFVRMANRVAEGEAALLHQGTWTATFPKIMSADAVTYRPFPGTSGTIDFQTDATVLSTDPDTPEAATAFVAYAGSTDAQRAFIGPGMRLPTRTDVDPSAVPAPLRDAYAAYREASTYVPSITHGLVFPPDTLTDFRAAFDRLVESGDVDATVTALDAVPTDDKS